MRVLSGRYELLEGLGQGGMGVVYRARDLELERLVAVKILPFELVRHPVSRSRFRREARTAAGLTHPNIAVVHDVGEDTSGDQPVPYLVMELLEGRTLAQVLDERGPVSPAEAAQVVIAILDALEHSHARDVVHRDIKPSNIMLTGPALASRIKVMDFGIAKLLSETATRLTATGSVMGTSSYLSPEQARGEEADHRADIYSLGCVFYELLTGRPPFIGDNVSVVMFQHLQRKPDPPSAHRPGMHPLWDAVVLRALAKEPHDRYSNAGEMRAVISAQLTPGSATTARTFSTAPRTMAPGRRTDQQLRLERLGSSTAERTGLWSLGLAATLLILEGLSETKTGYHPNEFLIAAAAPALYAGYRAYRIHRPGLWMIDALITLLVGATAFLYTDGLLPGGGTTLGFRTSFVSGVLIWITAGIWLTRLLRDRISSRTAA